MRLRKGSVRVDSRDKNTRAVDFKSTPHPKDCKARKKVFSFWGAAKFTLVLSLLLWWLPIFGQMIAGYVGGRKAGSPNRGMLAALIPVGLIMIIIYLGRQGILPEFSFLQLETSALIAAFGSDLPQLTVYMEAIVAYMESFLFAVEDTTSLSLNSYIITVAFAYVGGILAEQTHLEMDYMVSRGNVQEIPTEDLPRSWKALRDQKVLCFECFDDCMPLGAKGVHSSDDYTSGVRGKSSRESVNDDFFLGNKKNLVKNEQTFSGLLHRAELCDPEKERSRYRRLNEDCDCV